MFHTRSLVQQPTQTWNGAKDSPSCAKRGPKGLSNYRLSFDKVAWLYNPLVFLLLMVLVVSMVTAYLFGTLVPILLLLHNVFLCLWRRRAFEFRNRRKEGEDGAVWVLQRVSDREKE